METRRQALKKRKAEEDTGNELIQVQKFKILNQSSLDVGSRDIIISSVNPEDNVIKQEVKTELEEVGKGRDFEFESSDVKFEIVEQKVVVVNEEEVICGDDEKNESGGVLDICVENTHSLGLQNKSESYQTVNLEEILPLIIDHLELITILYCREVCKKWREIMDNFLHEKISEEPFDNEKYLSKMKRSPQSEEFWKQKYEPIKYAYVFFGSNKLKKFIDLMRTHCDLELSPFVGHAKVTLANTDRCTRYSKVYKCSDEVRNFIQLFGKCLNAVRIEAKYIRCVNSKFYFGQTIQMCLEGCPNLKTFYVHTDPCGVGDIVLKERVCSFDYSLMPSGSSLPKNLESFSLNMYEDCSPSLSDLIMNRLIQPFYNEQIVKLKIIWKEGLTLKMPRVRDFTLCIPSQQRSANFERFFSGEWLEAPKIEKFCLKSESSTGPDFSVADMLKMMKIFPTVRYLKLDYPISSTTTFKNIIGFRLNNIHTLELTDFYGGYKLPDEFLCAFPKLKYLKMRVTYSLDCREVKSVQLLSESVKLKNANAISVYESELWEMAEDLERVEIQRQMCTCDERPCWSSGLCPVKNVVGTREGYQKYCERFIADN